MVHVTKRSGERSTFLLRILTPLHFSCERIVKSKTAQICLVMFHKNAAVRQPSKQRTRRQVDVEPMPYLSPNNHQQDDAIAVSSNLRMIDKHRRRRVRRQQQQTQEEDRVSSKNIRMMSGFSNWDRYRRTRAPPRPRG